MGSGSRELLDGFPDFLGHLGHISLMAPSRHQSLASGIPHRGTAWIGESRATLAPAGILISRLLRFKNLRGTLWYFTEHNMLATPTPKFFSFQGHPEMSPTSQSGRPGRVWPKRRQSRYAGMCTVSVKTMVAQISGCLGFPAWIVLVAQSQVS